MLLRARVVYPVSRPPIADGYVRLEANRITEVGAWADDPDGEALDLGEVMLMPGLVNAHAHLDYTSFVGAIPPPPSFTGWINAMVDLKADVDDIAHCASWQRGARQCLRNGITTVGNIESRPDLLPSLWPETPLRMVSFLELIQIKPESDPQQAVDEANEFLENIPMPRGRGGLSPHAPYTTKPEMLAACARSSRPLAIHLAESAEEDEMFRRGTGPLRDRLAEVGRMMDDCGQRSPVAHARCNGVLQPDTLVIHANYLDADDVQIIASSRASVVHCQRSHDYFRHAAFPADALASAGINICLGTDSLATVRDAGVELSLSDEMRLHADAFPGLLPKTILERATVNGAQALGMAGQVGEIVPGAFADLMAVPCSAPIQKAAEELLAHAGPTQCVMVDGHWEVPPPSLTTDA